MRYLVTGATGFIGRHLLERLLQRDDAEIFAVVRPGSAYKLEELRHELGATGEQLRAVHGDLTRALMGVSDKDRKALRGTVDHFFHLAAIYDITADDASQQEANVEGTRRAVNLAVDLQAGCFDYVSTIGVAGFYDGTFTEDMFDEANKFPNPYLRTKHDAEGVVRAECSVPYRIYRPSMVVGHSRTGFIDKVDGPYYMFPLIQWFQRLIPRGVPAPGITTDGVMNLVPVDFVAAAMDHIAHLPDRDGQVFFLTDNHHYTVLELLNIFSRAAGGPRFIKTLNSSWLTGRDSVRELLDNPRVHDVINTVLKPLGIPADLLGIMDWPTRFDNSNTLAALEGSGITVPELETYAANLWQYWESHLAPGQTEENRPAKRRAIQLNTPDIAPHLRRIRGAWTWGLRQRLSPRRALRRRVEGKVVVITGASSGIGAGLAHRLARAGATVVVTARSIEKLQDLVEDINAGGGSAYAYRADLSNLESCDRVCREILNDHGQVDILVNNAGRSIRRSIKYAFNRFHDYERTMQLNYFGAIRMAMNLLPQMSERRSGHIVNVSTVGVQDAPPRFSAYLGSKFALEGWTMAAANEFAHEGIEFSLVNYPLVRTPMIAPTRIYDYFPAMSPEQAVDWLCEVIVTRPKRKVTPFGLLALFSYYAFPKTAEFIVNTGYQIIPESFGKPKDAEPGTAQALPDNVKPLRGRKKQG